MDKKNIYHADAVPDLPTVRNIEIDKSKSKQKTGFAV